MELYLAAIFLSCIAFTNSLSFMDEEKIENELQAIKNVAVLPLRNIENPSPLQKRVVKALDESQEVLNSHEVKVVAINCLSSIHKLCSKNTDFQSLALFQEGKLLTELPVEIITTHSEAESIILHWLNREVFGNVGSQEEWEVILEQSKSKHNVVLVYLKGIGTQSHSFFIQNALKYQNHLKIVYTTDVEFAESLTNEDEKIKNGDVYVAVCMHEKFPVTKYSFPVKQLKNLFQRLIEPLTILVNENAPGSLLKGLTSKAEETQLDILMLATDSTKQQNAIMLAQETCSLQIGYLLCVVIIENSTDAINDTNLINLSLIFKGNEGITTQGGTLKYETTTEILHLYQILYSKKVENDIYNKQKREELLSELVEDVADEEVIVDDPVSFAVHYNRHIVDLYLYDYKTIPRVTDIMYEEISNSEQFSVLLFTLEFNAKSIAALSLFVNIHKKFLGEGGMSPLYRVECFDWPDVCDKANITTYPRMLFYNSQSSIKEYKGIWDEHKMKEAIELNANPKENSKELKKDLSLVEMTIYNYEELMASPLPLLIQFINETDDKEMFGNQFKLKLLLNKIANIEEVKEILQIVWINSSNGTVGEYVLSVYSNGSKYVTPLALLDKQGSVHLKSFENFDEDQIQKWVEDCLSGREEISYELEHREWKARLEGYDYIQILKEEGKYPIHENKKVDDEIEQQRATADIKNSIYNKEPIVDKQTPDLSRVKTEL